jgi:hypothetical protein
MTFTKPNWLLSLIALAGLTVVSTFLAGVVERATISFGRARPLGRLK